VQTETFPHIAVGAVTVLRSLIGVRMPVPEAPMLPPAKTPDADDLAPGWKLLVAVPRDRR
jgi:hypothetical protein